MRGSATSESSEEGENPQARTHRHPSCPDYLVFGAPLTRCDGRAASAAKARSRSFDAYTAATCELRVRRGRGRTVLTSDWSDHKAWGVLRTGAANRVATWRWRCNPCEECS